MKQVTQYQCEKCGKLFSDATKCKQHEAKHPEMLDEYEAFYTEDRKFPWRVNILFDDNDELVEVPYQIVDPSCSELGVETHIDDKEFTATPWD